MLAAGESLAATASERLVGRAAERELLAAAVIGLRDRELRTLVILGEPGIGKSRMLAELRDLGDQQGAIVLLGSGAELEADLPYAVFVDALDAYVAGLDPYKLSSLENELGGELSMILPSFVHAAAADAPASQDERYRAHRAICELLERIAATKPLVLLLDDVHWADPASVELIGALLRRPPDAAVLIAMAGRPRQLSGRLTGALDRAEREGAATQIHLTTLTREEARALLGETVDDNDASAIYSESGGNPFYLQQLARSPAKAVLAKEVRAPAQAEGEVPAQVASALREELALLSPGARALLKGASVAGDPFELDLAVTTSDLDPHTSEAALDELISLALFRTTEVPRRFRFRHPLVRRAVYANTPPGWILGAHARCAAELEERGAALTLRAHHIEHAAVRGDEDSIAALADAGTAVAMRAPATAARWFGAALRLLPENAAPEARLEFLVARAKALAATGEFSGARKDLLEALELTQDGPIEIWVELTVACAGVEHVLASHAMARGRLEDALDRLSDPEGPEAIALLVELSFDELFRGELMAMRETAERALAVARPLRDPPLVAYAASVVVLACAWGSTAAEAIHARDEALPLVDSLSDDEAASRLGALVHLAAAELYVDLYDEAFDHAARAQRIARATGQVFPTLIPTLATAHYMRGRLKEATEVIEGGIESARLANSAADLAWRLHIRSATALATDDLETCRAAAEEAYELTRGSGPNFVSAYPGLGFASALHATGDPARAVEVLVGAAGGEHLPLIPGGWRAAAHELLARCHIQLGNSEDATGAATHAVATAAAVGSTMSAAWANRAKAAVTLDSGDPERAATHALRAVELCDEVGSSIEGGVSRVVAGRALAAAGDEGAAITRLDEALAALEAMGAVRYRNEATMELRRLGRRVHRQTRAGGGDGVDSLTERELQVARLVVDRKTNAAIASELFLSVKTIESHMSALFRKLNVSSRVDVARMVESAERDRSANPRSPG